ncbi:MAG: hypothetical protein ACREBE_28275 [bacterium]
MTTRSVALVLMILACSGHGVVAAPREKTIVFVCEHGSVKSLIAQEWFNRRAKERGLAVRAVSRGATPDASVPVPIVEALQQDGFDVRTFKPSAPTSRELRKAARVVAIGLRPGALGPAATPEAWDDIPPTSGGYAGTRDALRAHIEALLSVLAEHP